MVSSRRERYFRGRHTTILAISPWVRYTRLPIRDGRRMFAQWPILDTPDPRLRAPQLPGTARGLSPLRSREGPIVPLASRDYRTRGEEHFMCRRRRRRPQLKHARRLWADPWACSHRLEHKVRDAWQDPRCRGSAARPLAITDWPGRPGPLDARPPGRRPDRGRRAPVATSPRTTRDRTRAGSGRRKGRVYRTGAGQVLETWSAFSGERSMDNGAGGRNGEP